jgi:hypothetical protein
MATPQPHSNRHHYRVWLKLAIESGVLEKLPPSFQPDESQPSRDTEQFVRRLLSELRDPDASKRPLKEIIADAHQFRAWVGARRKDNLRQILVESRPEDRIVVFPPRRPTRALDRERPPRRTDRIEQPDANPRANPMWDDWVDHLNL